MSIMPAGLIAVGALSRQWIWWLPFGLAALFPLALGCRALAAWIDDRALIIIDGSGVRWRRWYSSGYRLEPWSVIRAARLERSVRQYGSSEYIHLSLVQDTPDTSRKAIISAEYLDLSPEELLALLGRFTFTTDNRWRPTVR